MRIRHTLGIVVLTLLHVHWVSCFFDPVTLGVGGLGLGLLGAGYHKLIKCKIFECCNDDHIPINVTDLQQLLATRLYGQHIVQRTVVRALRGYKATANPPKALALSFHGPAGTGKNYVSSLIISSFYKRGMMSDFFHLFSGSTFSQRRLEEHKEVIKNIVIETLLRCERSIFVFDEVHKMPEGLLDVLLPFLDYGQPIFIEYESRRIRLKSNRAIFIFLSNAGAAGILDEMLKLWLSGRKRDTLKLQDFENSIGGNVLRENNGFLNGSAIEASLIDYYVPFLPLEEEHVKLCVRDAFDKDRYPEAPTPLMEQDVLSTVIYGPSPYNIYATAGCKRLETKVASARQIDKASAA